MGFGAFHRFQPVSYTHLEISQQVSGFSSVIFSMRGVSYMDISGAQAFLDLLRQVQNQQAQVFLCGVSPDVYKRQSQR